MQRAGAAREACHPFRSSPRRHQTEADLRESDTGVGRCDPEIARDGKLRSAAQRIAVQSRDDRDCKQRQAVERGPHAVGHRGRIGGPSHVLQLLEVAARAESLVARAAKNQDANVAWKRRDRLVEFGHRLVGQRVARVRPVDRDRGDAVVSLEQEVTHQPPPPGPSSPGLVILPRSSTLLRSFSLTPRARASWRIERPVRIDSLASFPASS